ncbi:MAG: SGNH/GDSL hydrolase family protein [Lachnospiraceae bacterium]|nr:SGNH/GDSL hydrolase family protein [Lachnospiraceae bacterium]
MKCILLIKNIVRYISVSVVLSIFLISTLSGCHSGQSDSSGADSLSANMTETSADNRVSPDLIAAMAAPTDTDSLTVTEEMINTGIQNPGNLYRLMNVMERAAHGEEITIAYIGGSITDGSSASPKDTSCYAYLSTKWWEDTFPDATINYINAGIGATDSYLGVHRLQDDVLVYEPDLVITEFSVNDYRSWNKETYESLLRAILLSDNEPAVIALLLGTEQDYNYATEHAQVAFKLSVSTINYASVLSEGRKNGTLSWEDVGNPDGVHPANGGHALIAHLLTQFYCNVLSEINTAAYPEYVVTEDTLTKSRYENADLLYASDISSAAMEGFTQSEIPSALSHTDGWATTTGGTISFEITSREAGIVFYQTIDGQSGQYDVYVDGVCVTTIDADYSGGWGNCCDYVECYKNDISETHLIELKPSEDSTGDYFAICGICVGY